MSVTTAPASAHVYEKRSVMKSTLAKMIAFHNDPGVLGKLSPPPLIVQVIHNGRQSLTEGEVEFRLWFGPFPIRWLARHEPGPTSHSFADVMVRGPLAYWRHEHIFEEAPDGVVLIDRVTLAHHPGIRGLLTRLMFDGVLLRFLFFYRHLRTRYALKI